jgi:hypothetical protein
VTLGPEFAKPLQSSGVHIRPDMTVPFRWLRHDESEAAQYARRCAFASRDLTQAVTSRGGLLISSTAAEAARSPSHHPWRRLNRLAVVAQPARIALARAEGLARLGADSA